MGKGFDKFLNMIRLNDEEYDEYDDYDDFDDEDDTNAEDTTTYEKIPDAPNTEE